MCIESHYPFCVELFDLVVDCTGSPKILLIEDSREKWS